MFAATLSDYSSEQRQIAISQWKSQPVEEPEVMENLAVLTYRVIGHEDIWFPRFYSILFGWWGEWGSFFCLKTMIGTDGSVVGTFVLSLFPYGISASRTFILILYDRANHLVHLGPLPLEPTTGVGRAILAGLLCGLTLYIKLHLAFFIAGVFFSLVFTTYGFKQHWTSPPVLVMALLAILPALVYQRIGNLFFKFIVLSVITICRSFDPAPPSYVQRTKSLVTVLGYAAFYWLRLVVS